MVNPSFFNRKITLSVLVLVAVLGFGISGYILLEDYSFLEGLYMAVITLSTVGYGEIRSLTEAGRWFSIIFIIVGLVTLAFTGRAVVESLLETTWGGSQEAKKMMKKILKLKGHFIVCGYGRVGSSAAEYLCEKNSDFIIIESNPEYCQTIKEKGLLYIEGDATEETTLLEAGVKNAAGLLCLLNSDPDNLFLVLSARELNPSLKIISRAADRNSERKIFKAGADSVISLFSFAGRQVAEAVLTSDSRHVEEDLIKSNPIPQWIQVEKGSALEGKKMNEASACLETDIFGIRRDGADTIFPDKSIVITGGDRLLINAERHQQIQLDGLP